MKYILYTKSDQGTMYLKATEVGQCFTFTYAIPKLTMLQKEAKRFNLLENAQELATQLGMEVQGIEVSELEEFMQFMNDNLEKLREGSQARKTLFAMIRLYDMYRKEQ